MIAESFKIEELQQTVVAPGDYELRLYTFSPLSQEKLDTLYSELHKSGRLTGKMWETLSSPSTLHIPFREPEVSGTGVLPFAVLVVLALGAVGVAGILGWSLGKLIGDIGETIKKIALPAVLILGGILLLSRQSPRRA